MTDFRGHASDTSDTQGHPRARVEAAKAPVEFGGVDPEMMAFGLKLALGVTLFQLSLAATLFGHFTRG
jgi:hypothetical protein